MHSKKARSQKNKSFWARARGLMKIFTILREFSEVREASPTREPRLFVISHLNMINNVHFGRLN